MLLITPPFTQLNTPYPATAYLKGFLNTLGYKSFQADLGIEVILEIFSTSGLQQIFKLAADTNVEFSENSYRIFKLQEDYIATIDSVIRFLQHKNPSLAHSIADRTYLPEASRFEELEPLEWAFGTMGIVDLARHLATLYLEDLGDFIKETIDPHFGFSRYAERLGRSLSSFETMHLELQKPDTLVSQVLVKLLDKKIKKLQPKVVCISIPFPGNLFGALKCGQYLKQNYPAVNIVLGGGYVNTELRSVTDERLFDYVDFVSLDDGEAPLQFLFEHLNDKRKKEALKRVFAKANGVVSYYNNAIEKDIPQRETGTPDYSDFLLKDYLSVIEIVNPMHRLWSDGRWNKLTLAHGCYWGKCSFCDISLDYIKRYEPMTASLLCDRIETIIAQTGETGFHFVDEAAPPALMRDLALEIIRRKITVTWWTNIRFEKSFTKDVCLLLKKSGCIAVSGGLEVASDRLLEKMKKGVTVAQVARVADAFTQAGIMVHAYLMYGFPTQTKQETIDSLEMVRQLFMHGVVQSGFWHLFAMTAHSPVGLEPATFGVVKVGPDFGGFADNDLSHEDPQGCDHELFSEGLKKSLFNYMHGVCFDFPLSKWFGFKTPQTTISKNYIVHALKDTAGQKLRSNANIIWLGNLPETESFEDEAGDKMLRFYFYEKQSQLSFALDADWGYWLNSMLPELSVFVDKHYLYSEVKAHFENAGLGNFEEIEGSEVWAALRENGLVVV